MTNTISTDTTTSTSTFISPTTAITSFPTDIVSTLDSTSAFMTTNSSTKLNSETSSYTDYLSSALSTILPSTSTCLSTFNPITTENPTFDLNNNELIKDLISSGDLAGCLVGCMNNGRCKIDDSSGKYRCFCNTNISGRMCNFNLAPCAAGPCMNRGDCLETESYPYFTCNCTQFFIGFRCEHKIDLCKDETCSGNGYCLDINSKPTCICYQYYLGETCSEQSARLLMFKTVKLTSLLTAIASFAIVGLLVVIMDILKYFVIKPKNNITLSRNVFKRFNNKPKSLSQKARDENLVRLKYVN